MARKTRSKQRQSLRSQSGGGQTFKTADEKYEEAGRQLYIDRYRSKELERRKHLQTPGARPRLGEPCVNQMFGTQCEDSANQFCSGPDHPIPNEIYWYDDREARCIYRDKTKNEFDPDYDVSHWYDPNAYAEIPSIVKELRKIKFRSDNVRGGQRRTRKTKRS